MENKADNKVNGGKVAIIGAIITAVAGIVTSIVSISGPLMDKQLAIQTTQTREAVVAAMQISALTAKQTETPMPGNPPAPVEDQAQATETQDAAAITASHAKNGSQSKAASEATPDVMLKVGEDVTSNGITVKLTQVEFPSANEVHLHFTFTNTTKKVVAIKLNHNRDVTLTDDKGTVYSWASDFDWEVSIYPGTSRNDEIKRRGDVSKANYFVIKLTVPDLLSAQWKD